MPLSGSIFYVINITYNIDTVRFLRRGVQIGQVDMW